MRKILFKAKLVGWKDNPMCDEWVKGHFCRSYLLEADCIRTEYGGDYRIDINTLCQYTGENDGEEEIWENDIYKISRGRNSWDCKVEFHDGSFCLIPIKEDVDSKYLHDCFKRGYKLYKLGNVFDNPELIECKNGCE